MVDGIPAYMACGLREFDEAMDMDRKAMPVAEIPDSALAILASKYADVAKDVPSVPFYCPAWRDHAAAVRKAHGYAHEIEARAAKERKESPT